MYHKLKSNIWCMVSEIWSATDRIFSHFGPFSAWRYIILHKCTKNHDHILYCSWDMALDRCNCYFSYWAIFCHFTPLTSPKNQNIKKMKKTSRDIIILHKCSKSRDHMLYCSMLCNTDIWCMTGVIVIFHFGIFLPFYSLTVQNIKILKK